MVVILGDHSPACIFVIRLVTEGRLQLHYCDSGLEMTSTTTATATKTTTTTATTQATTTLRTGR
jgi:hypothetical protein